MRTKALLCAASLLAAGVATSMAQSNVYSLNVVGYVNVVLGKVGPASLGGLTFLANPLDAGNNSVSNLFATLDPTTGSGYAVLTWNGFGFIENDLDQFGGGWGNPTLSLAPGQAFFFKNLGGTIITNTFVGNVLQGNVNIPIGAGAALTALGSKVPQSDFVQNLGLVPTPGHSTMLLWNGNGYEASGLDEFGGGWGTMPSFTVDNTAGPMLNVGQGAFYQGDASSTATWVRNFTVQ